MNFLIKLSLVALLLGGNVPAQSSDSNPSTDSAFALKRNLSKKRNYFLPPLESFLLPGFDQWYEGQYSEAMAYTGTALAGLTYGVLTRKQSDERHSQLGFQLISAAGGFSAYHSFRAAVSSRKPYGEFSFLTQEETMGDILMAPLRFDYLIRPTTIIPVSAALVLAFVIAPRIDQQTLDLRNLTTSDLFFSGANSYLAGTWEECAFRGWLYPAFAERFHSPFWSNVLTSAIFGAAHFRKGFIPWPQFLFGLYQGYVTQKREWTISESIFIHTWWDIILFAGSYATQNELAIQLPVFQAQF